MKKFITCLLALALTSTVWAQERNRIITVAVTDVSYHKQEKTTVSSVLGALLDASAGQVTIDKGKYVDAVRARIIGGISKTYRLRSIDGQYKPEEVKDDGSTLYADATLTNISTTQKEEVVNTEKKTKRILYKAQISVTVNLKDAATDKVVNSTTFNISDYDCSWVETAEGAITNALERLQRNIRNYYDKKYPLRASIIEGASEKKDKQKEVYIDLGSADRAFVGMHLAVRIQKTIAGKDASKEVGKIKITELLGDDISLCKVQKGGAEIKEALEKGENVVVVSLE